MPAGIAVGQYTALDGIEIQTCYSWEQRTMVPAPEVASKGPDHLQDLYKDVVGGCQTQRHRYLPLEILSQYDSVFSKGDQNLGRTTTLMEHSIPLKEEHDQFIKSPTG